MKRSILDALRVWVNEALRCKKPPEGWYCTRGAGHEGPCAALPYDPALNPFLMRNKDGMQI